MSTSFKKSFFIFFIFFIVLAVIAAIGPRISDDKQIEKCVVNIDLPGVFGISLDCDSPEFLRLSQNPSLILEEKNTRQSRPGIIIAANLLSYPFKAVGFLADLAKPDLKREAPLKINHQTSAYFPVFLAYAFINFILIIFSAFILFYFWKNNNGKIGITSVILSFFIIANPVFLKFFWSPHTQIFNIFTPLFLIWLSYNIWNNHLFESKRIYLISLLTGIALTFYGVFIMFLPVAIIPAFFKKKSWKDFIFKSFLICILFILPIVFWVVFVKVKAGSFYSHEVSGYKQFVWMFDYGIIEIISIIFKNLFNIFKIFFREFYLFILIFIFSLFWTSKEFLKTKKELIIISLLMVFSFAAFFALAGYFEARLVYTMVLPLILLSGVLLNESLNMVKYKKVFLLVLCLFFALNLVNILK